MDESYAINRSMDMVHIAGLDNKYKNCPYAEMRWI